MGQEKFSRDNRLFRILYVNHASKIAGAEQCLVRIMASIDRSRYEPFLVCPDGGLAQEAELRNIRVLRATFTDYQRNRSRVFGITLPNPMLALWNAIEVIVLGFRIARVIRSVSVDLIHANSLLARIPAYIAGKITGIPVVWHVRDILSSKPWLAIYDFLASHGVARLITVSNACHVQFTDLSNVTTVYDGIDPEAFKWDAEAAARVRETFGWDRRHTVFGIFGRISSTKGHHHFLDSAIMVHSQYPMTRWLVVGEAWSHEEKAFLAELRRRVSQAGLDQGFLFTGFRTDVSAIMAACDVVVAPSVIQDSFPNTVLEGMACSRTVLAFPVGGIPEAIADRVSGLLVKRMDAQGLAEAMISLIENPSLRERLGSNARKRVVKDFNVQKTQEEIQGVYDEILETSRLRR